MHSTACLTNQLMTNLYFPSLLLTATTHMIILTKNLYITSVHPYPLAFIYLRGRPLKQNIITLLSNLKTSTIILIPSDTQSDIWFSQLHHK